MHMIHCDLCNKDRKTPSVWPLNCACGRVYLESGEIIEPLRGFGDWVAWLLRRLFIRKRKGCKCGQRQRALNLFGREMWRRVRVCCLWLAPNS